MPAVTKNTLQEKEDKKSYGHKGELLAVRYLQRKKYDVLETNFRFGRGEIDIIAKDKDTLVFVEVKTRRNEVFGYPEEGVNRQKQKQIKAVARGYLFQKKVKAASIRFDVIAVCYRSPEDYSIHHIPDAF
ncbi:MAG: YraN family protein [Candidatus Aminicenantes bacterium 4484_214]|nr:MAG: YraN family protein [Candidatus Aminicenantes bacterium 4484_214]RLE07626.1 MAG: YraN family protein [Candidatus Aminicenantes bacterium]